MKIAFISTMNGNQWGGSEELWSKTAFYALQKKQHVLVSVYDWKTLHPKIAILKQNGATILLRDRFNNKGSILYKTFLYFKNRINFLNNHYMPIIKWSPDHVVINQGETFDISVHHIKLFELLEKYKINYSLLCHSHEQYGFIPENVIYPRAKKIFQLAKHVFFVSHRMQKMTERRLCMQLNNGKITWNPLNLEKIDYIEYPKGDVMNFSVVGPLGGGKGQDTILECFSSGNWNNRNWKLNFYGKGYGEAYLKDLAIFYKIEDRVIFHGFLNNTMNIWKENHIILIASVAEGLPLSLLEAMICGRPAVVTDVGGNTEVITEDFNGFVAEAPSVSSFSKALEKAWLNKNKWQEMGVNAHKFCKQNVDLHPETSLLHTILDL